NGRVSNDIVALECDVDTKSVSNNKFIKKALHGLASEERLTPFVLQSAQASRNPNEGINASAHEYLLTQAKMKRNVHSGSSGHNFPLENGSNRHFDQHSAAHNMKDE
ncbi:hypothetical protein Golob_005726, partial [Gossypium lobatum]|nr:hypothetical protein [Gossypium lobatum]